MKLKFKDIISPQGSIGKLPYFTWGLILFGLKYYLDKLANALIFDRFWLITDYFIRADEFMIRDLSHQEIYLYSLMALTSIPFIWFGTVLCIKRLRSTNLSPWLVLFFFIPFLNFLLFLVLSVLPDNVVEEFNKEESFVGNIIPKTKRGSAGFAISITLIISLFLTMFSANFLEEYGWGLFIGVPFFIGFGTVMLSSYHQKRTFRESLSISLSSIVLFGFVLLGIALEGFICVIMAFPIGLVLGLIGGIIAYYIQRKSGSSVASVLVLVLSIPLTAFVEKENDTVPIEIYVSTSVIIDAPIAEVWNQVVNFDEIESPTELMFLNGISYPIKARLEYKEDTVRYCVFNNGTFIEPITKWEEPNLLEFSVVDQPEPMQELSPYGKIDAPHLHGYFNTTKGQFKLIRKGEGQTELIGTTWYYNDVWPNSYWRLWSDYIIHTIHSRVLNHIKVEAEENV